MVWCICRVCVWLSGDVCKRNFLQQRGSACFLASVSVEDTCLLHIRWIYHLEWGMSPVISLDEAACGTVLGDSEKPLYVLDWPQSGRGHCAGLRWMSGLTTPERWLFNEQLHLAALSKAMNPTPQKCWLQHSLCDLMWRSFHVKCERSKTITHLQLKKKTNAAKSRPESLQHVCFRSCKVFFVWG